LFPYTSLFRSWLGLMQGTLEDTFEKGGRQVTRKLKGDRSYKDVLGKPLVLKGRSLLLVRNVGHLMTTDAVLLDGKPVGEGLMDAALTALCALHDKGANARDGAIYVVKPKMHGPEEVAFACAIFVQRAERGQRR